MMDVGGSCMLCVRVSATEYLGAPVPYGDSHRAASERSSLALAL